MHVAWPSCAWLQLNFSPFPVGRPMSAGCSTLPNSFILCYTFLRMLRCQYRIFRAAHIREVMMWRAYFFHDLGVCRKIGSDFLNEKFKFD